MHATRLTALAVRAVTTVLAAGLLLLGCQGVPRCDDLENLSTDANRNGFPDIVPPEGVSFEPDQTVRVRMGNTLTEADLLPHAREEGVDPNLAALADFLVTFRLTARYDNGTESQICQTVPLGAFDFAFETACPESTDLDVELTAVVPLFGIPLTTIPLGLTTDVVDYQCGQTVDFVTTKDENGQLV